MGQTLAKPRTAATLCRLGFTGTPPCPLVYTLQYFCATTADLSGYNRNRLTKPKIFTNWPFTEKVCKPSSPTLDSTNHLQEIQKTKENITLDHGKHNQ